MHTYARRIVGQSKFRSTLDWIALVSVTYVPSLTYCVSKFSEQLFIETCSRLPSYVKCLVNCQELKFFRVVPVFWKSTITPKMLMLYFSR